MGDDDDRPAPTAIVLMAEYGGAYLWNRSPVGTTSPGDYAVDPVRLGVSAGLIQRMTAWNDEWEASAYSNTGFPSPAAEQRWRRHGRGLAHELQNELPHIEVLYHHDPRGEVPVRDRHG